MTAREAVQLLLMLDCNQEFGQPRVAITLGYCQAVRHSTLTAAFAGPNPATPVPGYSFTFARRKLQSRCYLGRRIGIAQCRSSDAGAQDRVAQMVEQFKKRRLKNILTARAESVSGSSPDVVNK